MKPAEIPQVKIKYKNLMSFTFQQLVQKLAQTPTNNRAACAINRVVRELDKAREVIVDEFQAEVAEKFGKRDEAGKLIRPEGQPKGYEPLEGKDKELDAAHDIFEKKEASFRVRPLTPSVLSDIKISAAEIEALGGLFSEEEGPGIPSDFAQHLASVKN